MKKILGLDLGTNSIGWALIERDFENREGTILGMGSRIIPMTQDVKDEFGKGNSISQTADRTKFRGVRRLRERHLLRRERLHRVLNVLGFLPTHYNTEIDFVNRLGQFLEETEPKIAWKKNDEEKFEFLFQGSFQEMVADFSANGQDARIPYDWTIYYLRKKALSAKIEKEELAWIILNFNQKRGYYQLRGEEEEENPNKLVEFHSLKIVEVIADEKPNNKGETWYSLHLENGWVYRRSSKTPLLDWKDKVRDFIVTTDLNDDGSVKTDKEGAEKRSFRAPSEDDWTLIKKKTEQEIAQCDKTVGTYIYDTLVQKPTQKIRGKLVRTVERKFYKEELKAILKKQIELQPELFTDDLYSDCVRELYRKNEAHQTALNKRDFVHLFVEDIIFYQRPLRSQKSNIGNCSLEYRVFKVENKEGNEIEKIEYLKAIPKSHPLYQEFRLWQWLYNLKIYQKADDKDITGQFIQSVEDYEQLFDFLNERKEIKQDILVKHLLEKIGFKGRALTSEITNYRWNYVEDKVYPCNETGTQIRTRLSKLDYVPDGFLTPELEYKLWHLIYSVTDKIEFEKALKSFANKHGLDEVSFVEGFRKFPPFKGEYGSFSEKAIKKLLPLMRLGKYWDWDKIDGDTKNRIWKIITGEVDEEIKNRVREKAIHLTTEENFQGVQLWLAQYVVYDRHSEANNAGKWNSVADLEKYLEEFKQHSLRNPIVEQVVTETLRVVRDIWAKYGSGIKDFFNEIHIELGREMKNTAEDRKKITNQVTENENTNLRIKALLAELLNDGRVENVRPFSPMQQETLKVYEEYALGSEERYNVHTGNFEHDPISDEILKISKTPQPTKSELQRYKLWLEQRYRSPYTGQMIPLNKLFTSEYEIEHIIPQSRYFDDSFSNKVICESAINKLKDKNLGLEFIKKFHGTIVETGFGRSVRVFEEQGYQEFIKERYAKNRSKRNKLLLDEIPDKMIERQMNDTRYISKFISNVLSNIVRADNNDDGVNSKNVLPGNGKITTKLKQDWGLNDVWNDLILPRFERMNLLTNSTAFTAWNENHQKFIPIVPLEYSKGFSKKRIDHRHHALDALVIACATGDHINLLNNQSAKSETSRFDLQNKLRNKEKWQDNQGKERDKFTDFKKPWDNFTLDVKNTLEQIVVSFKQNLRVINKTTNRYEKYVEKNGKLVKELVSQTKGDSWAIRKSLHTPMPYGKKVFEFDTLKIADNVGKRELIIDEEIKIKVEEVYQNYKCKVTDTQKYLKKNPLRDNHGNEIIVTAFKVKIEKFRKRQPISELSNRGQGGIKTVEEAIKFIDKVADFKIRQDLLNHLKENDNDLEKSFSAEGLERFNAKRKIPIYKLPIAESGSGRFAVGNKIGTRHKWVEADKGTNLFLAIYQNKNANRSYRTIPLNIVIERQKQWLSSVPDRNEKEDNLLFYLSPNDLVYVPTVEEQEDSETIDFRNLTKEQVKQIYKMVSTTQDKLECVPVHYASPIRANEMGSNNKSQNSLDGIQIKSVCIKLKIDRLGNISKTLSDILR
ncbi:type II CRISPR RNA-guided endonuclease Cas9 [Sphingobacterium olei]|uniref:CRISPR-associated endonuclease Cas9 n=1 Tax=Sphingobacterium olei TaxID=2571155 RepID=A0A4U0P6C1_9SPHI|nr:type II CRISPR RNA-guided endonuclease Cas9 [Sphingobacterium olei]TJZ62987.1 type II CRISPR RNA-guided endonuclease Cas9 [Sphingobacterium olei]